MADADQSNLTMLTVDLLSAYVTNNTVQHGDLSELIKSTHAALKVIDSPEEASPAAPEHKPAVSVRKSLASPTHILSMIDGKPYQTLKRHLSKHGLTPQEYRERYSLARDYPMVAKAYSESRRAIAERLGLGRKAAPVGTSTETVEGPPTNKAPKAVAAKPKTVTPKAAAKTTAPKVAGATKRSPSRKAKAESAGAPPPPSAPKATPRRRGPKAPTAS
ncbi:MucR family transcriptional regulator [Sphingomonas oryzagri]